MVNLKKFRGRRKTILIGDIDRDQDSMNYRLRPNCKYVELSGILMKKETGRGIEYSLYFENVQSTDICRPLNPLTKIKINLSRSFIF